MTDFLPAGLFECSGSLVHPNPICAGPWDPRAMHGGAPTALVGRFVAAHRGGEEFHLARLTVELIRPVPIAPLEVEVRIIRPGKRVQLLDAVVRDGDGVEVVKARGLRLAKTANRVDEPNFALSPPPAGPPPTECQPYVHGYDREPGRFYMDAFDMRHTDGNAFGKLGPSAVWLQLKVPVFAGEQTLALDRLLASADFGNGVSNVLDSSTHAFINPDLTVNIHRLPDGEWVHLHARTHVRCDGYGTATGRLSDRRGELAIVNQSLLVGPR